MGLSAEVARLTDSASSSALWLSLTSKSFAQLLQNSCAMENFSSTLLLNQVLIGLFLLISEKKQIWDSQAFSSSYASAESTLFLASNRSFVTGDKFFESFAALLLKLGLRIIAFQIPQFPQTNKKRQAYLLIY